VFVDGGCDTLAENEKLILIVVESLESWTMEKDIDGINVTPNLRLLSNNNHVLFCDKIKSQAMKGNSGDGQFTINTGLTPLVEGVPCMHYANNVYPNFAHFFKNSVIINPWPHIWNQDTMSVRYSYQRIIEPIGCEWEDIDVMTQTFEAMKSMNGSSCIMALTVSTHSPFTRITNNSVSFDSMITPPMIDRYLKCINYSDSIIGAFVERVINDSELSNSTIVITSDHTVFKPSMVMELNDFFNVHQLSVTPEGNYCPLIIYSPKISKNTRIDAECYQMDIFPTILSLLGCDKYYWQGVGVNILDSVAIENRRLSESDAFEISDLLIRSNYFSHND